MMDLSEAGMARERYRKAKLALVAAEEELRLRRMDDAVEERAWIALKTQVEVAQTALDKHDGTARYLARKAEVDAGNRVSAARQQVQDAAVGVAECYVMAVEEG